LAPEHPFPASVDDTIAVYREMLKTYKPGNIAIFGTSAGTILTAETAVKIKQLKLPMPAALGIFSGSGDLSQPDDSLAIFGLDGLKGPLDPPAPAGTPELPEYVGKTDPKDPVLSPIFAGDSSFGNNQRIADLDFFQDLKVNRLSDVRIGR
jgi:acetyl esterase/lipase